MNLDQPFTLVLGGGGMKGLAHIGVLRALAERGRVPSMILGTSMGAMIGATWAAGMTIDEMAERARRLRRRDVFQIAHTDMAFRRMQAPAVYRREPLDLLLREMVGELTFDDLRRPLLVNTVDLEAGIQRIWGAPGYRDVRVADAVFASCALPGILPPRELRGRLHADGAVVDNLPVRAAALAAPGPIIAVDVGGAALVRTRAETAGFAGTYIRALEIVMQTIINSHLAAWTSPDLLLIRPELHDMPMFAFDRTDALLQRGYRATLATLDRLAATPHLNGGGIYPKREVLVSVDAARCTACGYCSRVAPAVFRQAADQPAQVIAPRQIWSPVDGAYLWNCPAAAITARTLTPDD